MMAVDTYMAVNGRVFVSMQDYDGERGNKRHFKEPRLIETADLYGRRIEDTPIYDREGTEG